jgi:hypothetical protein
VGLLVLEILQAKKGTLCVSTELVDLYSGGAISMGFREFSQSLWVDSGKALCLEICRTSLFFFSLSHFHLTSRQFCYLIRGSD